jgi:O-antigen/teichoic acid export membrane protein
MALADQMIVSAANFATGIVLVRGLGLAEFGKYSIAYSLLLCANALQMSFVASPMLSIAPLLPREERQRFVSGMLAMQIVASLLLFALFALVGLVARIFTDFYSLPCILLFACCVGTFQLQDWLRRYYFLANKGKLALANDFISYGGQLVLVFFIWRIGRLNLALTFLAMCATSIAALVMGPVTDRLRPAMDSLNEAWQRCKVLSRGLLVANQVRWFGGQGALLIGAWIVGSKEVGGLRAAQSLAGPMFLVLLSLENIIPIRMGDELKKKGAAGAYEFTRRAILGGTFFFTLVTAPMAIFGKTILRVLYGPALAAFYLPMLLQLAFVVVSVAAFLWFHFYRSVQDSRAIFQANLLSTITSLLTVYLFGRLWSASGIVLSFLLGQFVIIACYTIYWIRNRESIQLRYPARDLVTGDTGKST